MRLNKVKARTALDVRRVSVDAPRVNDFHDDLSLRVAEAAFQALELRIDDPSLRPAKHPRHGDFQANLALSLAPKLGQSPREIADRVAVRVREDAACREAFREVEVAGPGFLNLWVRDEFIGSWVSGLSKDARLGVPKTASPDVVVVDYSSPNLAKEMHVGHLRSTIIGDAICRILAFNGDRVIRQNHLGDWGTQFGMLLQHLVETAWDQHEDSSIRDLNDLYQLAKARFDSDPAFMERARERVVRLQSGDPESRELWLRLIDESVRHMKAVYARLGVLLEDADVRGESFYNDRLPAVIDDLREKGILVEDQGAQVVFPEGMQNKEGEPLPLFVQKRDGGYGYATTDLAAARFRAEKLSATRIIYVVDARQGDHFKMVFWTLRAAGFIDESVSLEFVPFGTILGADGSPFKTRAGGTVRLTELLDEAETRAEKVLAEKNPELPSDERSSIARAVAVGAVKYADLSSERIKDYTFDYERMLAFDGNTAPYLQYAYVRIQSIFRKGSIVEADIVGQAPPISVEHEAERALAFQLLRLPRVVSSVVRSLEPHRLCGYLYELASLFHAFHRSCRVLNAESDALRLSRLGLCLLTKGALGQGLDLLGIQRVDKM